MANRIFSDIINIGIGANVDLQPAVGQDLLITDIGSDTWVGAPPAAVPAVNVGLFDGALGPAWFMQSTDVRGWMRKQKIYISRTNYLRFNNPGMGAINVGYSVVEALYYGPNGTSKVVSDVQNILAGANLDVQPPAGYEYEITDVGSSMWVGGAPLNLPDVTVSIFDGVTAASIMHAADVKGWNKPLSIFISNGNYLRLTNTNGAAANVGFSGIIAHIFGINGRPAVTTDVVALLGGANADFRPAVGTEWEVTEVGGDTWVGVAPAALPNISVNIFDGVVATILMTAANLKGWNNELSIFINRDNYLRITELSAAPQDVCISAKLTRLFNS